MKYNLQGWALAIGLLGIILCDGRFTAAEENNSQREENTVAVAGVLADSVPPSTLEEVPTAEKNQIENPQNSQEDRVLEIKEEELEPPIGNDAWRKLDPFQNTITREVFEDKLNLLFDPQGGLQAYIKIDDDKVTVYDQPRESPNAKIVYTLHFSRTAREIKDIPRTYRTATEFRTLPSTNPLEGLRVAIDPGHIGGVWGPVEMRSTQLEGIGIIQEGDFNIITAKIIREKLQNLGARVFLTRETTEPVTTSRPSDFYNEARQLIFEKSPKVAERLKDLPIEKQNQELGRRLMNVANYIFARTAEKIARAEKLRKEFQADITIVLYINATPSSGRGKLTIDNRNTFFIHGCYSPSELEHPSQRLALFEKILSRTTATEFYVATKIAESFTKMTALPPVLYGETRTTRQLDPENAYVVARNLAGNREYPGPVVVTEPYFMNNRIVALRLLAGDYDGEKEIDGTKYTSIYREYAMGVVNGLLEAYGRR